MNNILKKHIINHIFEIMGLLKNGKNIKYLDNLLSDKFLINKKISFQLDDENTLNCNIWAAQATVEQSAIKVLITNISDDNEEYVLFIQMDTFPPFCLQVSQDIEDNGSFMFCLDKDNWLDTSTLMQANVLAGIESVSELLPQWNAIKDYEIEYQFLLSFLNFKDV